MKAFTTLTGSVLVVLVAVLLVPMALGAVRPDDRSGVLGPGSVAPAVPTHPNDQAGPLGTGAVTLEGQPAFWQGERDSGLYRPDGAVAAPDVVVPVVESPSGWDWTRIGFGAAIAAALALMAAAVTLTLRQHGGPGRPVPH